MIALINFSSSIFFVNSSIIFTKQQKTTTAAMQHFIKINFQKKEVFISFFYEVF